MTKLKHVRAQMHGASDSMLPQAVSESPHVATTSAHQNISTDSSTTKADLEHAGELRYARLGIDRAALRGGERGRPGRCVRRRLLVLCQFLGFR